MFYKNINDKNRQNWLENTLLSIPKGMRILDAGAGEMRHYPLCKHLTYVSQDFCQYKGAGDGKGLQTDKWDTSLIDLVCDITDIPEPDNSFDVILCTEVFEHLPNPADALDEFTRLLKPGGQLILTAPFASLVHFAPYHYCTGFSRYWYEYHLERCKFKIKELVPNGDWFLYCQQELMRLGSTARAHGDWAWPFAYILGLMGIVYFKIRGGTRADDLACFGWHCIAIKD
jgi:SAM-dependent methyltransferase